MRRVHYSLSEHFVTHLFSWHLLSRIYASASSKIFDAMEMSNEMLRERVIDTGNGCPCDGRSKMTKIRIRIRGQMKIRENNAYPCLLFSYPSKKSSPSCWDDHFRYNGKISRVGAIAATTTGKLSKPKALPVPSAAMAATGLIRGTNTAGVALGIF